VNVTPQKDRDTSHALNNEESMPMQEPDSKDLEETSVKEIKISTVVNVTSQKDRDTSHFLNNEENMPMQEPDSKEVEETSVKEVNTSSSNVNARPPRKPRGPGKLSNKQSVKPPPPMCLASGCKFQRKRGKGISFQCLMCNVYHHSLCLNITKEEEDAMTFFSCPECRLLPSVVKELKQDMDFIKGSLTQMFENKMSQVMKNCDSVRDHVKKISHNTTATGDLIKQLSQKVVECNELRDENTALKVRLAKSEAELEAKSHGSTKQSTYHEKRQSYGVEPSKRKGTLVLGTSIVRPVQALKPKDTTVVPVPGAHVKHLLEKYQTDHRNKSYDHVIIEAGTNDISDKVPQDEIISTYKTLVDEVMSQNNNVSISSITPRTDFSNLQDTTAIVNSGLEDLARETHCDFIMNDKNFLNMDGTINSDLLTRDGIHLSNTGAKRLASNMGLEWTHESTQQSELHIPKHHANHQSANRYGAGNSSANRFTSSPYRNAYKGCYNCGEENHNSETCWYDHRLTCQTCGATGHKSKHHRH